MTDILRETTEELENYFGTINEIKAGIRTLLPEKPGCLIALEMMEEMGIPLVAGGLMDQPHIWLMQVALVRSVRSQFEVAAAIADSQ